MRTKGATRKGVPAKSPKAKSPKRKSAGKSTTAPQPPADPAKPLDNDQHERFCLEWVKDGNGARAYMRAYGGDNPDSAKAAAARLLAIGNVLARKEFLVAEALSAVRVEGQQVLVGMARAAYYDIRKAFDEKGALLPIHRLPDEVAFAIAGIEVVESATSEDDPVPIYTKKVRFNDRIAALGQLGKHFKLFTEKVELAGPNGGPVPVQQQESPEAKAALARVQKRMKALEARLPK
jgi:phage terminase small subunit